MRRGYSFWLILGDDWHEEDELRAEIAFMNQGGIL